MFTIGLATGIFAGTIIGFSVCAILAVAKRSDEMPENLRGHGQD